MLADPMVGYWCRVGSQALTHTRNDVAILVQRRSLFSILLSHPTPVRTKVVFYCTDNRSQHESVVNTGETLGGPGRGGSGGEGGLVRWAGRFLRTRIVVLGYWCRAGCQHFVVVFFPFLFPQCRTCLLPLSCCRRVRQVCA